MCSVVFWQEKQHLEGRYEMSIYKVGDLLVHPQGGLVRVIGTEESVIDKVKTVLIQTESVHRHRDRFISPPKLLRRPVSKYEAEKLLDDLEDKPKRKRGKNPSVITYSRVTQSQSNDPKEVLDLIWELRPVGESERRQSVEDIFQNALYILASELTYALDYNLETAKRRIQERLKELGGR